MAKVMAWSQLPFDQFWRQALSSKKTAYSPQYILHPGDSELSYQDQFTKQFQILSHSFLPNMSLFKIYKIKKHITSNDYQKWHLSENKNKYPLSVSTKATQNRLDLTLTKLYERLTPLCHQRVNATKNTKTTMKKLLQDNDCPSQEHGFTNHAEMSYSFQQSCSFKLQKIKHLVIKTISRNLVAKLDNKTNTHTHTQYTTWI